mgnify:CR=1 FL=1
MWFWLSLATLICWSGSDLFSKIGCRDAKDKYSHLKMVMAVGLVMGLHAMYEIFVGGTEISLEIILTYLPVSLLDQDPDTLTAAELKAQGIEIYQVLQNNDAYNALKKVGGLVITGPTGTNVNDVAVALVEG